MLLSAAENLFFQSKLAIPHPIGGTQIATPIGPINAQFSPAASEVPTIAAPTEYATLFTGPPISKAIIAPQTAPTSAAPAPPPERDCKNTVKLSRSQAHGVPIKNIMQNPVINVASRGTIIIAFRDLAAFGRGIFFK